MCTFIQQTLPAQCSLLDFFFTSPVPPSPASFFMAYNPFAPADAGRLGSARRHTRPARWPPIFETKLSSLEWVKGDGSTRKRSRPESEPEATRSHSRPYSRTEQHRPEQNRAHQHRSEPQKSATSRPASQHQSSDAVALPEVTTIMGFPPLADDRVRYLVNFMLEHVTAPDIEIEAKLGFS